MLDLEPIKAECEECCSSGIGRIADLSCCRSTQAVIAELEEARALLGELAEYQPLKSRCGFCYAWCLYGETPLVHDADCLWLRAQKWKR
jgi:hypothetical protein